MKKKGWTSLTVKLNTLIIIIVLVLSLGLAAFAYDMNSKRVDKYYKQTTSNAACAIAAFVDGDKAEALLKAIKTDEFTAIREEALAADGDQAIIDWLQERGLYDTYTGIRAMLKTYKEKLKAEYVYLQSLEGYRSINIVDPDEAVLYTGSYEDTPEEYTKFQTNMHIESVVSNTEYGWLCSAYEPVVNSRGENVAIVGVDINMNDVMEERGRFLTTMVLFAAALMLVSVIITVMLMRRIATKPLSMLAKATTGFVDDQTGYLREKIINLPKEQYVAFLAKLASQASVTGDEEIILNARDRNAIGKDVVDAANAAVSGGRMTLSESTGDFSGGLILKRGNVEANCTVELLVDLKRGDLSAKLAKVLFSD